MKTLLFTTVVLTVCFCNLRAEPPKEGRSFAEKQNTTNPPRPIFDKQDVKNIMDKVNQYQLVHPRTKIFDDNWIRGTYYTGVMACYQATGDAAYLNQCEAFGKRLKWRIPAVAPGAVESGANLLTVAQTYIEGYMMGSKDCKIKSVIAHLDNPAIRNPVSRPLDWYFESGRRYVDGLFTGPPTLAMLYSVTKDKRYLHWMNACFWDVHGKLYDTETNLYYRDERFFPGRTRGGGKKIIWSRGNGWAFAGMARILKYLPKDNALYRRYELVFKNMAKSLKSRQSTEGFWYPNLDNSSQFPVKETSGTAFFVYGFAYGINSGILDRSVYLPVVEKGWQSLCDAVGEDGKVQWGQVVGDRPTMVKKEDSHEYVSGTFLLAASEIYKLANSAK
jgi:rhamnogalacturonyl hydrolase YesR